MIGYPIIFHKLWIYTDTEVLESFGYIYIQIHNFWSVLDIYRYIRFGYTIIR